MSETLQNWSFACALATSARLKSGFSSLSSPKQQDSLKSATFLFSGGTGKRDDTRNQTCAQDSYPTPGWRHLGSPPTSLTAFAEERALHSGRRPSLTAFAVLGSAPFCVVLDLYPVRFCCLEQQCIYEMPRARTLPDLFSMLSWISSHGPLPGHEVQ